MSTVSAETFAQSVRKACTCTKENATPPARKAMLLPTALWNAAVLHNVKWVSGARGELVLRKESCVVSGEAFKSVPG